MRPLDATAANLPRRRGHPTRGELQPCKFAILHCCELEVEDNIHGLGRFVLLHLIDFGLHMLHLIFFIR